MSVMKRDASNSPGPSCFNPTMTPGDGSPPCTSATSTSGTPSTADPSSGSSTSSTPTLADTPTTTSTSNTAQPPTGASTGATGSGDATPTSISSNTTSVSRSVSTTASSDNRDSSGLSTTTTQTTSNGSSDTVKLSGSDDTTQSSALFMPTTSSGVDELPTSMSSVTVGTQKFSTAAEPTDAASHRTTPIKNDKHIGEIAGGVLGFLALFITALTGLAILRRRRRASRTAPSSEFMHMTRNGGTGGSPPTFTCLNGTTTPAGNQPMPYSLQDGSVESGSDDPPPPFTEGWFYGYTDPVLDKVREAADMREQYWRRSESFATAREFKLGDDESKGHETGPDDSTEEGDSIFGLAL